MPPTPDNQCDLNRYSDHPCPGKGEYEVENSKHDKYRFCSGCIGKALRFMASLGPLTVQPVFANWRTEVAQLDAETAAIKDALYEALRDQDASVVVFQNDGSHDDADVTKLARVLAEKLGVTNVRAV